MTDSPKGSPNSPPFQEGMPKNASTNSPPFQEGVPKNASTNSPPFQEGVPKNASTNSPPFQEGVPKNASTNSPPFQGGVAAGRGGYPKGNDKLNNRAYLRPRRKVLRHNLTPAEAKLWIAIKNNKLAGKKFRRQQSVGNYILDFYCPSEKLAIELDGDVHFQEIKQESDSKRTLYLRSLGIRVLRFENRLVFEDIEWVLGAIKTNFGWNKKE
jgi:very-short-patch-repair endonuclease